MWRRVVLVVLLTAAAALTVALSAGAATRHDARVVGHIRLCGGPAPGRCSSQRGVVSVYRRHHLVARQHSAHGRFRFNLAPGRYTLTARSSGAHCPSRHVHARAHRTVRANIVCPIR